MSPEKRELLYGNLGLMILKPSGTRRHLFDAVSPPLGQATAHGKRNHLKLGRFWHILVSSTV